MLKTTTGRPAWFRPILRKGHGGTGEVSPAGNRAAEPDAVAFAAEMGFVADERQAEVLLAMADPAVKQGILNCTRQWGKSTTAAAGAVFRAVTRPKSLIVVASPSKRQSGGLVRKAEEMVAALGIKTGRDGIHPVSLVFPNGSRIIGLPMNAATVRGLSAVSLLLIDEASRVSEELYHAVSPMVAVARGDVWLMS